MMEAATPRVEVAISIRAPQEETIVTVTFEPNEEGTRLTLVHLGLSDATGAARHEVGWQSILRKCQEALDEARQI